MDVDFVIIDDPIIRCVVCGELCEYPEDYICDDCFWDEIEEWEYAIDGDSI